jgi:hypothetical protein
MAGDVKRQRAAALQDAAAYHRTHPAMAATEFSRPI